VAVDAQSIPGAPVKVRSHRLRRTITILAIAGAFAGTFAYWLATTGATSTSIAPPLGTPTSGNIADVTPLTSSSLTLGHGSAQVQAGVGISELVTAATQTNHLKIDVSWSNAFQATKILAGMGSISVGVYHPLHTGTCNISANQGNQNDGGDQTVTSIVSVAVDSTHTYCMALDESATGPLVSTNGKLTLNVSHVAGFLLPKEDGSAAANQNTCGSSAATEALTDPWCLPSDIAGQTTKRALYVVASIQTPGSHGTVPPGQQGQTLNFTVQAFRAT